MRLCGVTDLEQARGDLSWLNTAELEQYLPPKPNTGLFGTLGLRAKL